MLCQRVALAGPLSAARCCARQVVDDILDVTATSEELGKTAGKDMAVNKARAAAQRPCVI